MGKKGAVANATSSGKAALKQESSLTQESNEGVFSGVFASEVVSLCVQHGSPAITVCPRSCGSSSRFAFVVDIDPIEQELISAMHIRGWLLTESVAAILRDALAGNSCKALSGIHLWNVGLTPSTLTTIIHLIIENNIREFSLDGNTVASVPPLVNLLQSKSMVRLSMKSCNVTNELVQELTPALAQNKTLLHLNLSCNCISDSGCAALATSLRLNRTLLTLSLTGNSIGNSGIASLAQVLSQFPLEHSEIVQRRKLRFAKLEEPSSSALDVQNRVASPRGRSPTSTTALHKSSSKMEKVSGTKSRKAEQKKDDKLKKDDKPSKKALEGRKSKTIKEVKGAKRGEASGSGFESPRPEPAQTMNPLELPVKNEHGRLYLPGNVTLVSLSLAYNDIGSAGMHRMLDALRLQTQYSEFGPGLLRLTLDHNSPRVGGIKVDDNSEQVLREIAILLANKNKPEEEAAVADREGAS